MQRPPLLRALDELGGIAPRRALVSRCGRAAVDLGLRTGDLVVLTRGIYSSPELVGEPAAAPPRSMVCCRTAAAPSPGDGPCERRPAGPT